MNKTFSKSFIIPPLELTLIYIVLNYCLRDMTCFTDAEDNFISLRFMWQKTDCSKYHSTTEPMSWKKNVSTSTVRRKLCEAGLYSRIAVNKPLLRKQNNVKRFHWAKLHINWTIEQWNKALWTDKSKFEIFGSDRRVYVQRRVDKRVATPCIIPTIKHRGGSVIVWKDFANCKVGDLEQVKGKLNQTSYYSIVQHHMIPSEMQLVSQGFVLMQYKDPNHMSKLYQRCIKSKEEQHAFQLMSWPVQSMDLKTSVTRF